MRWSVLLVIVLGVLYGVRLNNKGCQFSDHLDLSGKLVVITGATSGIGFETAKAVAAMNGRLVLPVRDLQRGHQIVQQLRQHTQDAQIDLIPMDMQSLHSVQEAARAIASLGLPVHYLINNAGVWMGDQREVTPDNLETTFAVNHLAHFVFTLELMERIKEAKGRVVTVSSHMHMRGSLDIDDLQSTKSYSHSSAYAASKIANILFSNELAKRYKEDGVTAVSLHPGVITTNLHREQEKAHPWLMSILYHTILGYLGKTTQDGCQTTLTAAFSPRLAEESGVYLAECAVYPSSNPQASDEDLATRLWDISEALSNQILGSSK